jgi:hypothetical protein
MTSRKLLVICLLAAAYTGAHASDAQNQQAVGSIAIDSQSPSGVNSPAQTVPKPSNHGRNPALRSNLSNIKRGVVKEMRATSAFVQQEAAKPGTLDDWLIVLAALGLIVLQLRRKHKSLPQSRIARYG